MASTSRQAGPADAAATLERVPIVQPDLPQLESYDPREMQRHAEESVSDDALREALIISSEPDEHVRRIHDVEDLGATIVVLMNVSGADPLGAIRTYGDRVLPALRG
jgi:coenzyme F420-dependent glucose-6-phosphate dehydrogenase